MSETYDPPSDEFQQAVCFGGNSTLRDLKEARRECQRAEELNVVSDPALMGKPHA